MKLVLFDIDGTLIDRVGSLHARHRFLKALNEVYSVTIPLDTSVDLLGYIDRQIAWTLLKPYNVTKDDFDRKFQQFADALFFHTKKFALDGTISYIPIPEAVQLATVLKKQKDYFIGLLTGNTPAIAWWKLDYVGIRDLFSFGVFGDDVEDRIALAQKVFLHAKRFFKKTFSPQDITVIGDTVFDVRCGKAIGAKTIAVSTGGHLVMKVNPHADTYKQALLMEQPDVYAQTLMDKTVLDFFGLHRVQQQ